MSATNPHPGGIETAAFNFCPHCGGELDRGLAQHMANGLCEQHTSGSEEAVPKSDTDPVTITPPLLEEHDEREHVVDDLDQRRRLADELTEAGVWPTEVSTE